MELLDHIKSEAAVHDLPWQLVRAVCLIESSLNPFSRRYEPRYKWLYGDATLLTPNEVMDQKHSWGLMQVMGAVAREYGWRGDMVELCRIPLGITYGCLHLAKFRAKYELWTDAISAYNAGSPRRTSEGAYENQQYVTKVVTEWTKLDPNHQTATRAPGSESKHPFLERSK